MGAGYDGSIRIDTNIDTKNFNKGIASLTSSVVGFGKIFIATKIAQTLFQIGKQAINTASDLKEVQNVVDTAFGDMSYMVEEFADTAIDKFGLSELAAKRTASTYMAMNKGMGITGKAAAQMAINVAGLTGDMASFYNVSQSVADTALKSIWTGETESLKQFGIVMTQTNLQQFAYAQGINKKISAMSQAEQVSLRYEYVMKQLGLAQGDFAKTSGSWANQTRILTERWNELLGLLGNGLIEILLPVVKFLNKVLDALIKIFEKIGDIYNALTGKKLVKNNNKVADSASDAANAEEGLADGIDEAAKSAKKALAPFDELNILQSGLSGDESVDSDINIGDLSNDIKEAESGIDGLNRKFNDFFFMLDDRRNDRFFKEAIKVPAPEFAKLPDPVYKPNWGLELPSLPAPVFQSAVAPKIVLDDFLESKRKYQEIITPPKVEPIVLPSIVSQDFNISLESTKENYKTTIEYIRDITEPTLFPVGIAFVTLFDGISKNAADWGNNIAGNYRKTLNYFPTTTSMALGATATAYNDFLKGTDQNTVIWGNGLIKKFGKIAEGMHKDFVSGLISMWDEFVGFMNGIGEKISNWWSGNKKWAAPVLVGGLTAAAITGIVISGGTLAPAMGALIPALASIPALATGAVIPPNSEFLAILGDQKSGKNIEAPENLLRQIVREELGNIANGGEINIDVPVYLDGDIIGQSTVKYINGQTKRIGTSPILL